MMATEAPHACAGPRVEPPNNPPRVSIGVPVYNGERFLSQTLDSLVAQTFRDFEVILSDNASTDATARICHEYVEKDPRFRYVCNPHNIGSTRNFNQTVALATAPYFKSANADDLCEPELVAQCVAVLDTHPEVVLCYGRATLIDETGQRRAPYDDNLNVRQSRATDRFWAVWKQLRMMNILQGVMRTEALRRTGLLGPYIGSDMVLAAELSLYGQFFELPDRLFHRRIHAGAFSSQTSTASQQSFVNPQRRARHTFYRWRHHFEHYRAVLRSPLPATDKARLVAGLTRLGLLHWRALLGELVEPLAQRRQS